MQDTALHLAIFFGLNSITPTHSPRKHRAPYLAMLRFCKKSNPFAFLQKPPSCRPLLLSAAMPLFCNKDPSCAILEGLFFGLNFQKLPRYAFSCSTWNSSLKIFILRHPDIFPSPSASQGNRLIPILPTKPRPFEDQLRTASEGRKTR